MSQTCSVSGCSSSNIAGKGLCWTHYQRQRRSVPMEGSTKEQRAAWMLEHANHQGEECLIWPFSRPARGYGPYRKMTIIAHGRPPFAGAQAAHSCGNGTAGCVNPKHLRWATPLQNIQDKFGHGTMVMGEQVHTSKLSAEQVREIQSHLTTRIWGQQRQLAYQYGVSEQTICDIKKGRKWVNTLLDLERKIA